MNLTSFKILFLILLSATLCRADFSIEVGERLRQYPMHFEFLPFTHFLPEKLKTEINEPITIEWGDPKNFTEITPHHLMNCQSNEMKTDNIAQLGKKSHYWGEHKRFDKILLNPSILENFLHNPFNNRVLSQTPTCRHGTLRSLIQATLYNRLALIYDDSDFATPPSQNRQFLSLTRFIQWGAEDSFKPLQRFTFGKSNQSTGTEISHFFDMREFDSPKSSFSVNFEYMMLSGSNNYLNYRPATYLFLSNFFNHLDPTSEIILAESQYEVIAPSKSFKGCPVQQTQPSNTKIDLSKIENAYIMISSPGKAMRSRWGHAYLALKLNSHSRNRCNQQHPLVAFSFRESDVGYDEEENLKNEDSDNTGLLNSLIGRNVSYISIESIEHVRDEVIATENRQLFRYELKLDEQQKTLLSLLLYEYSHFYRESWYSLGNNCTSQLANVFQVIFPNIDWEFSPFVTPKKLVRFLRNRQIIH